MDVQVHEGVGVRGRFGSHPAPSPRRSRAVPAVRVVLDRTGPDGRRCEHVRRRLLWPDGDLPGVSRPGPRHDVWSPSRRRPVAGSVPDVTTPDLPAGRTIPDTDDLRLLAELINNDYIPLANAAWNARMSQQEAATRLVEMAERGLPLRLVADGDRQALWQIAQAGPATGAVAPAPEAEPAPEAPPPADAAPAVAAMPAVAAAPARMSPRGMRRLRLPNRR